MNIKELEKVFAKTEIHYFNNSNIKAYVSDDDFVTLTGEYFDNDGNSASFSIDFDNFSKDGINYTCYIHDVRIFSDMYGEWYIQSLKKIFTMCENILELNNVTFNRI